LFAGFPVWWLLGFSEFIVVLVALPMLRQLLRRQRVLLPPGFGIWALFLAWVLIGVFVLWADAPGAVPGGDASRILLFGFRAAWYLACTVLLLWLGNSTAREVSFQRVVQLLGFMFVVTAAGGLLGLLAPDFELRSALELALPGPLRTNSFVNTLVHLEAADVQAVLGRPEPRPKAPFAFANSWGSNLSLFLPFFLLAWGRHGRAWQRALMPFVLVMAAVPVVYSLNRGLWFSLLAGGLFLLLLQLRRGRPAALVVTVALLAGAIVGVAASPLGEMLQERIDNPHSNDRRSQLVVETVQSTTAGSPVVGFGSTRDVQGSFASIAGGDTPDCPACAVPPLGTQGHLWMLVFSQGLVGAALFLSFVLVSARRAWACRTESQVLCTFVLLFFGLQLAVYDSLGMPLATVMVAIALVWREQSSARQEAARTLGRSVHTLRRGAASLLIPTVIGAAVGGALAYKKPEQYSARASILLAPSPVHLAAGALEGFKTRETTVDTEAALALADRTLRPLTAGRPGSATPEDLRERTTVTATPNTRVLHLAVRAGEADTATEEVADLVQAYLSVREGYLAQRRRQVLELLGDKRRQMESAGDVLGAVADDGDFRRAKPVTATQQEALDRIDAATRAVLLSPTSPGEVIRGEAAAPVRRQPEVLIASGGALGLGAGALAVTLPFFMMRKRPRRNKMTDQDRGSKTPSTSPTSPEPRPEELPSVDVVVATHNRPEQLRAALDAIWRQTYAGQVNCYVVFDQTEPDLSLARKGPRRSIQVLANDRSPGLAGARNCGILASQGRLVGFCDDDDEWLPTKLARQVEALGACDAPTSVTGIRVHYRDREFERVPTEAVMTLRNLVRNRVMEAHPSTVVVRREALLDQIGLVDEDIPGSFGEDYDWILRAAQVGSFAVVEEALVHVHWGQSLFSRRWDTIVAAIDYWLVKHPAFHKDPKALGRLYGQRAFALAALGRRREALVTAARAAGKSPRERRAYLAVAVALGVVSAERLMDLANKRGRGI